jgi:DNA-binding transcriptional MerR regulator
MSRKEDTLDEGHEFMELLEIQGTLDLVSKSDLIGEVRRHGGHVTDRQLTTYVTEGLVPKSARLGSRGGAYPRIVIDLVTFISLSRIRGLSLQAIRELLPVWRYLQRAVRAKEILLGELEYVSRQHVSAPEAVFAIPSMIREMLPCPYCSGDELRDIKFLDKNGDVLATQPVTIGFVMAQQDETGRAEPVAMMRIALPLSDEADNPSTLILGVPNGTPLAPGAWRLDCRELEVPDPPQEVSEHT